MANTVKSNLSNAIFSHDHPGILEALRGTDINYKFQDGNVLLWGITGSTYNLKEPVGKGDFDTVKFLLNNGADPKIKFLVFDPLYYATNEMRHDIVILLLNYGADPNTYFIRVFKDGKGNDICMCKTPLIHAIDNKSYLCVEALLKRGAIYNNETVKYAMQIRDGLYDKRKETPQDYLDFENANSVYTILKENYDSSFEKIAENFMQENMMTHKSVNYFMGMEK